MDPMAAPSRRHHGPGPTNDHIHADSRQPDSIHFRQQHAQDTVVSPTVLAKSVNGTGEQLGIVLPLQWEDRFEGTHVT